jgi:hypothetical protein
LRSDLGGAQACVLPKRKSRVPLGLLLKREYAMARITYRVVEHDGGWAYRVGDVFSETFPTRGDAHEAAERAAAEQRAPDEDTVISYEDEKYRWHDETARGGDRPQTDVEDGS